MNRLRYCDGYSDGLRQRPVIGSDISIALLVSNTIELFCQPVSLLLPAVKEPWSNCKSNTYK